MTQVFAFFTIASLALADPPAPGNPLFDAFGAVHAYAERQGIDAPNLVAGDLDRHVERIRQQTSVAHQLDERLVDGPQAVLTFWRQDHEPPLDPFEENNLKLYVGRELVRQGWIDAGLRLLAEVDEAYVADPSTLVFYRAACRFQLQRVDAAELSHSARIPLGLLNSVMQRRRSSSSRSRPY